eukprot:NODE_337_length_9297_cov_0.873994.p8 type:complete len:158 gc:universal NODE_337_length_9297_cov_0.873994:3685-3212(-)
MAKILNPQAFETLICDLVKRKHYGMTVTKTSAVNDGGVDFLCTKLGHSMAGEIKSGLNMGSPVIRNFVGAMVTNSVKNGLFIGIRPFSPEALKTISNLDPKNFNLIVIQIKEPKSVDDYLSKLIKKAYVNVPPKFENDYSLKYDKKSKRLTFADILL